MKNKILDTVEDIVGKFLYYDRKEDDELPVGAIEKAIAEGVISVDDIVRKFHEQLERAK